MLLSRHCLTISMLNRDPLAAFLIRDYFDLPRCHSLMASLLDKGLGQADLVLALLHLRDAMHHKSDAARLTSYYIHRLVGRPILVGPSCLLMYRTNGHAPRASRPILSDRRLVWVSPTNPRQPNTEAHDRWDEFRPGRTVAQLRSRGVTRRDLRRAERLGWVRFEEQAA